MILSFGCSGFKAHIISQDTSQSGEGFNPIEGSFCTTWTDFSPRNAQESALAVVCLHENGTWVMVGGPVDGQARCGDDGVEFYGYPQLVSNGTKGPLALAYDRCPGYPQEEIWVRRFDPVGGWVQVGGSPVNLVNSTLIPDETQFGPSVAWAQDRYSVYWKTSDINSDTNRISTSTGGAWTSTQFIDSNGPNIRHASFFNPDINGTDLYLHYGEPRPTVWIWNGSTLQSLPSLPPLSGNSLSTSLVNWNNQLVMAFTNGNNSAAWDAEVMRVQTATYNPTSQTWTFQISPMEQTPGHDQIHPFLFTIGQKLYSMYADYTTDGVPTDSQAVTFRFRVSQWDGSQWVRIPGESESLLLSQRFEFTQDKDRVVFSAIRRKVLKQQTEQIVVGWQNGVFSQVGGVVRTYEAPHTLWRARPGAVVALSAATVKELISAEATSRQRPVDIPSAKVVLPCDNLRGGMRGPFDLRSSSPAIDMGTPIAIPDFCQFNDQAPDIGATEYDLK